MSSKRTAPQLQPPVRGRDDSGTKPIIAPSNCSSWTPFAEPDSAQAIASRMLRAKSPGHRCWRGSGYTRLGAASGGPAADASGATARVYATAPEPPLTSTRCSRTSLRVRVARTCTEAVPPVHTGSPHADLPRGALLGHDRCTPLRPNSSTRRPGHGNAARRPPGQASATQGRRDPQGVRARWSCPAASQCQASAVRASGPAARRETRARHAAAATHCLSRRRRQPATTCALSGALPSSSITPPYRGRL